MEVNIHEAKTHFSKLLQRVAAGEEITIAKAGVPVARLVPIAAKNVKRELGLYRGEIWMADDFDAPLPDEVLAGFLGEEPRISEVKKPVAKAKKQAVKRRRKQ